jgi:dienelactone hydrolase
MPETTSFTSNSTSIAAELFRPNENANGGVVIIAHGTDGLLEPWGEQILGYGEALADEGFIAFVPKYFESTQTTPGPAALEAIGRYRDTWQQTLADAASYATTMPGADGARVGLLGFSLGGHLCLRLRSMASVLVAFFAPALDLGPANPNKLFAQIHHGLADGLVPSEQNLPTIVATLENENATYTEYTYSGANHGFTGDDPDNTAARDDSRRRTLQFFIDYLATSSGDNGDLQC